MRSLPLVFLLLFPFLNSTSAQEDGNDNNYPYWGEYHNTALSEIQPAVWIETDTTIAAWDWSLPGYVTPAPKGYLCINRVFNLNKNHIYDAGNINFPVNGVISHWVSWKHVEPSENHYTFQELIDNINLAAERGFGSIIRLHSSATKFTPSWLANYGIPLIYEENSSIVNYDVSHPEFHSRYLDLIAALGESGIPNMEAVKGLYVGYASRSNGDEGIGDDSELHVRERLDAWAAACAGVEHKVFMGGHSSYGFNKGFGVRRGFVEMYLYHIPDEEIGQLLDHNHYLFVDESNHIIKNKLFHGEENEEYGTNWVDRFGALESFPYRYFTANMRLLQMRCNYVMTNSSALLPEMLAWVGLELGRTIEDTPDAWCYLRESYIKKDGGLPVKNFERWVYQRDAPGYETSPTIRIDHAIEMWMVQEGKYYDYVARKGKKIGFNVDDRMFPGGEQEMAVKLTFYDGVPGTLKLVYENNEGLKADSVTSSGIDTIKTATFFINARMDDTGFDYDFDFILESEEEVPVLFVRVIKTGETYENTDQSPYGGIKRTIPGIIEAEHYDVGDPGFAYKDDDQKEGDLEFRPYDSVDVVLKTGASNDAAVSFTNEGEWLEYTVEATTGKYAITLYYYCGETPGGLVVSLDREVLDTITGIINQGWEVRDSIMVENISLTGGGSKILRLEFINGAGFDLDAIKFVKVITPVSGVSLSGCPVKDISAGDTFSLFAEVSPFDADEKEIEWNSSDVSIVSVDENGLVRSNAEGAATIIVTTTDGGFSDECRLNVVAKVISVYGVTIGECPNYILETGSTHQLIANVAPAEASDPSVSWNSSDPSIATVDSAGLVTAISQGTTTITITTHDGGYTNTCNIGVMFTGVRVTGLSITECPSETLPIESTLQFIANISPANAGDQRVSWSSSDTTVAKIDASGLLTGISIGNSTVTAVSKDGGHKDECLVYVGSANIIAEFKTGQRIADVCPNPVSDLLSIRFREPGYARRIHIYNLYGQLLKSESMYDNFMEIDMREFNSEVMVIVKVISGKSTDSFKVVID